MLNSVTVTFSWQLAAREARLAGFQFIEIEHILLGLLTVRDLMNVHTRSQFGVVVPPGNSFALQQESLALETMLNSIRINRINLRGSLRGFVGRGDYPLINSVIHRSEKCKTYFNRASELMAQDPLNSQIHMHHLLAAIIENPTNAVKLALGANNINADQLASVLKQSRPPLLNVRPIRPPIPPRFRPRPPPRPPIGRVPQPIHPRPPIQNINMTRSKTPFLDAIGVDITALAKDGKLEPLIGRKDEMLKLVRTLARKTKSNPLIVGEAGVGKTAIVKGLAMRIASKNVTPALHDYRIIELNVSGLVAGTKFRGDFEAKMQSIINEVKNNPKIILFIDEIHTIVGAGRSEGGSQDIANIFKPALASGELKCIGATTMDEYRRYFEKDAALDRRFQPIVLEEPTPEDTLEIINGLKEKYEAHHKVKITNEAIEAAVELSVKYIPERRLPDKVLDIVDEACSRASVSTLSFRGDIEDIKKMTGEVTEDTIISIVEEWSKRPVRRPGKKENERLAKMETELKKKVVGQDEAVSIIAQTIKMARSGLRDEKKPAGVFLFLGPTGVGKTELAKALTEYLFGSENDMIRLDMSEYMDKSNVARLIGAPPGYIGHDTEGQLTGKLRTRPYTVVLLDEIEKAHPEVLDIFLQIFDEGRLTDARGRTIDAKNAIFIMTSNIQSDSMGIDTVGFMPHNDKIRTVRQRKIRKDLKKSFRPEFLNRVDEIIQFNPLELKHLREIINIMLDDLKRRLKKQNISLDIKGKAIDFLCEEGYDPLNGVRPLKRTIERLITKPLSEKLIHNEFTSGDSVKVVIKARQLTLKKG